MSATAMPRLAPPSTHVTLLHFTVSMAVTTCIAFSIFCCVRCEMYISAARGSQAVVDVQATHLERTERHRSTATMQRAARSLFSCCLRVLAAWASTCTLQILSSCMTVTGTLRWICRCCCTTLLCLLAVCPFMSVFMDSVFLPAAGMLCYTRHAAGCIHAAPPSRAGFTFLQITVTEEHMIV